MRSQECIYQRSLGIDLPYEPLVSVELTKEARLTIETNKNAPKIEKASGLPYEPLANVELTKEA